MLVSRVRARAEKQAGMPVSVVVVGEECTCHDMPQTGYV